MSVNFYLESNEPVHQCHECGTKSVIHEIFHIGKSSSGWMFALHVEPDRESWPVDWWSWKSFIIAREKTHRIANEYNEIFTVQEFEQIVINRLGIDLARHTVDAQFCVGWGDGTYDLIVGEFS